MSQDSENRMSAGNSLASELARLKVDEKLDYTPYVYTLEDDDSVEMIRREFKQNLIGHQTRCEVTGIRYGCIASHIKPLRKCRTREESIDPANGLYLCKTVDELFDKGYVTFEDDGTLIVSENFDINYPGDIDLRFSKAWLSGERRLVMPDDDAMYKRRLVYLKYHRYHVFKGDGGKSKGEKFGSYDEHRGMRRHKRIFQSPEHESYEEYVDSVIKDEGRLKRMEKMGRQERELAKHYRDVRKQKTGVVYVSE